MEHTPSSKKREIVAALAVLMVVTVIVFAANASAKKDNAVNTAAVATSTSTPQTTTTTNSTTPTTPAASSTPTSTTASYKDGTYTATGSYESPGGHESITVSVTLQNGVIATTSAKEGAGDIEAQQYQDDFIASYKQVVVGKNISNLSVSRVGGSSLTSQGFNSAIQQIRTQAQA